uniref:Uncharacterized protein n=1 Tax=Arundo donax TaxID=35708 RepID=A0A0A9FY80_ARUDO
MAAASCCTGVVGRSTRGAGTPWQVHGGGPRPAALQEQGRQWQLAQPRSGAR